MSKDDLGRRTFCKLAVATAVLPACGNMAAPLMCGTNRIIVPNTSAMAVGTIQQIDRLGYDTIFICRDADGLYAMSGACTHNKCTVKLVSQAAGFQCDCHTATFDYNGQHPTDPAPSPLPHFAMCSDEAGVVTVDPDQVVDASVRLKG